MNFISIISGKFKIANLMKNELYFLKLNKVFLFDSIYKKTESYFKGFCLFVAIILLLKQRETLFSYPKYKISYKQLFTINFFIKNSFLNFLKTYYNLTIIRIYIIMIVCNS